MLTGIALPAASWFLLERWWITAPVAAAVLVAYLEQQGGQ